MSWKLTKKGTCCHSNVCAHFLLLRVCLEEEAEELSKNADPNSERLMDIYERLDELDASTAQPKAARILHGLGKEYDILLRLIGFC